MSGLAAIVLPSQSRVEPILDAMLKRMAHYPWLSAVERLEPAGHAGLGAVTFQDFANSAVATSHDGTLTAVLHGEFFDGDKHRRRFEGRGVQAGGRADVDLLLTGWQQDGAEFFSRLSGEFSAAIWDAARRELHVVTDRFGLRPTYVAHPAGAFGVASEIKSLLVVPGVDTSWSETGVAQFFSFGYFFNDNTLLAGVRAVPAATVGTYRLADDRYDEKTYWQLRPSQVSGSAADLSLALEQRFVAAVEHRAKPGEHLGLSLSGGLDARTILGVMPAGVDLKTVSLGIEGSLDHQSAAALAAIAGVPHRSYLLDASFLSTFEQNLRQMVLLTDGHYLDQGIVMPTMTIYRELGIDYLMRGHGGELLHMRKAYAFSLDEAALGASERELDAWLLSHLTGYMLSGVPSDLFTIDLRALAEASLRRAQARCAPVEQPIDQVWQLFLNERLHRETPLSMHTFGSFATIRQPYLDNDLIDALFSMPAGLKLGDELQTSLLRHRRPAFLGVTNANTGARLGAGRLVTEVARFRMRIFAKLGVKGYQPYERLGLWLRRELRGLVETALTGDALLSTGLFRPDVVKRVVDQHMADEANHTFLLMSLLIFALGLELRQDTARFSEGSKANGGS